MSNFPKDQVNLPVIREAVTGGGVLHDLAGAGLGPDQGREPGAGIGFIITTRYFYHGDIPLCVFSFKWTLL